MPKISVSTTDTAAAASGGETTGRRKLIDETAAKKAHLDIFWPTYQTSAGHSHLPSSSSISLTKSMMEQCKVTDRIGPSMMVLLSENRD